MIESVKENETSIAKVIRNILPIEWMRFNMYNSEDLYRHIPFLTFRVKCENDVFIALKKSVEEFNGNEKWQMFRDPFSKKGNYILSVVALKHLYEARAAREEFFSEKSYFGEKEYIKLCDNALDDIPKLLEYIQANWKKSP